MSGKDYLWIFFDALTSGSSSSVPALGHFLWPVLQFEIRWRDALSGWLHASALLEDLMEPKSIVESHSLGILMMNSTGFAIYIFLAAFIVTSVQISILSEKAEIE